MEFGRITPEELETVTFDLPADPPRTSKVLSSGKKKTKTEIFIGCAKWGRKDWIGTIYPPKTKEADFLSHYARQFNCIELNATFYKIPTKKQTKAWREKVGGDFLFCPKFSQSITHIRRLKNAGEVTERFLDGISGFGSNLGPLFLMPHPQMGPKSLDTMQEFVASLPADIPFFLELRHPEWFTNTQAFDAICNTLQQVNAGLVITDASGRRDCVHMHLTNRQAFIRFVGNGLHPSDYMRIDEWVIRIRDWAAQGIEKVYFFMHQHDELHSPRLCKYLIEQMNEKHSLSIPVPQFISK